MIYSLLGDVWSIVPAKLEAFLMDIRSIHECATIDELRDIEDGDVERLGYENVNGVAHIDVKGPLLKDVPLIFKFFGVQATSYLDLAGAMHRANNDPRVNSIQLDVDSPGGTVSGIAGAADAINAVVTQGKKRVVAHVDGMAASAAYWISSQASEIRAERDSLVGSIGVYQVVNDFSAAAKESGVKVHVIRSAPHKGVGVEGAEITGEHLASIQASVDSAHEMFVADVSRGRNMTHEQVQEIATGEVWYAADALDKGLIDGIGSSSANTTKTEDSHMAEKDLSAELVALNARMDELSEEKAKSDALVASLVAGQVSQIIEKGRSEGRITGPMVETVTDYAKSCGTDVAKFASFVDSLPVVVRKEQIGNEGDASKAKVEDLSKEEKSYCLKWGIDPESYKKYSKVSQISMRGFGICADGELVKVGG